MTKFIPVHEYIKKHNTTKQNVYRWIREGKFKDEDVKKVVIEVERIRLNKDAKPS